MVVPRQRMELVRYLIDVALEEQDQLDAHFNGISCPYLRDNSHEFEKEIKKHFVPTKQALNEMFSFFLNDSSSGKEVHLLIESALTSHFDHICDEEILTGQFIFN